MSYETCTNCGEKFHLKITSTEAQNKLHEKEKNNEIICFGCFKKIEELDVVQIIAGSSNIPNANIGDKCTVLCILKDGNGNTGYELENVLPDGTTNWEGSFERNQVKWLEAPNDKHT